MGTSASSFDGYSSSNKKKRLVGPIVSIDDATHEKMPHGKGGEKGGKRPLSRMTVVEEVSERISALVSIFVITLAMA